MQALQSFPPCGRSGRLCDLEIFLSLPGRARATPLSCFAQPAQCAFFGRARVYTRFNTPPGVLTVLRLNVRDLNFPAGMVSL